mmetsp:Transcript_3323/g.13383  ORF Transcript_3323/g.13383 Transcript_3323/m.13383 type:complete len:145 (+) Transcript_3323:3072-3506(+)
MSMGDDGGDGVGDADFCGLLARRRGLRRPPLAGDAGSDERTSAAAKMDGGMRSFATSVGDRGGVVADDANVAPGADALGFFLGVFFPETVFFPNAGLGLPEPGANKEAPNGAAGANGAPRSPASLNVGNVGNVGWLAAGGGGVN